MLVVDESRAMFCSSLIYTYILGRYSYCVLIQSKGFETKSLPRWCIWRLCGACMRLERKSNMGDCWYVRCSWILEKAGRPQPASSSIYSTKLLFIDSTTSRCICTPQHLRVEGKKREATCTTFIQRYICRTKSTCFCWNCKVHTYTKIGLLNCW